MSALGAEPVVVVGSGPAGVATAQQLVAAGRRVLLLESADRRHRGAAPGADGAPARGRWGHEPLDENRRRALGGTSTAWGGRCVPLDEIDFEARDWIPDSGWPIPHAEYARWLPAAARLLEIPETEFRQPLEDPLFRTAEDVDGAPIELWSPPTDVSHALSAMQRSHRELEVRDDCHVTGIELASDGRVEGLGVVRGGERSVVTGSGYVLATGALENARLLLASSAAPSLPALGRYYMSHVFATHMMFSGPLGRASDFFRIGRTYARHRWQLTPQAQRRLGVGNVIGFVARPPAHGLAMHLDPLSALVAAAKLVRRDVRSPRRLAARRAELAVYAKVLASAEPAFWPHVLGQSVRRSARNRLPMLLPPRSGAVHHVTVQAEHEPHAASRVLLAPERDRWGVPLLAAHIDFERSDLTTVLRFHEALQRYLAPVGLLAGRDAEDASRALEQDMEGGFNSNAHHIGTTRMGTDLARSVVDADCRVHGLRNLWVAGSSVFPTSGHANPTLSIAALSSRLGAHLAAL